jgi:acyl-CoA thioesterase-1
LDVFENGFHRGARMENSVDMDSVEVTARNNVGPELPNVLILGDSISIGYTPVVAEKLEGRVNVYRPNVNCRSTEEYMKYLSMWIDGKKWDLIHFNCGLHDIKQKKTDDVYARKVDFDAYRSNLEHIVDKLKKAAENVVWATTTPVPSRAEGRVSGDEVVYNGIANEVMIKNDIHINDLYSFVFPHEPECHPADNNVHYTDLWYKKLGGRVADFILTDLGLK